MCASPLPPAAVLRPLLASVEAKALKPLRLSLPLWASLQRAADLAEYGERPAAAAAESFSREERLRVLEGRAARGESLWADGDRVVMEPESGRVGKRKRREARGRESAGQESAA